MGSSSSEPFPLILTKCESLCSTSWCISGAQVPFPLLPFSYWLFSFTPFRKLSLLFECLMCSIRTLILLFTILPLTCLFVYMHAQGNTYRAFLFEHCLFFWWLEYHPPCSFLWCGQVTPPCFIRKPRKHKASTPSLSLSDGHFGEEPEKML